MKTRATIISLILTFGAFAGLAQTLTCTFQFTGSGILGTQAFTNAPITITTVGNTANRQVSSISSSQAGYYIVNDSASISISGVGAFQFTVPTQTDVVTPGNNAPGTGNTEFIFGAVTGSPYLVVAEMSGFNPWNMLSSLGPLSIPTGALEVWNLSPVTTNGGTVNLYDQNMPVTFRATIASTPPISVSPSRSGVLSHIAAGGPWTTVITLINTSLAPAPVTVALHNDDGSALTLPVTTTQQGASQTTTTSSVSATINPNATLLISMGNQVASTVVGWADVLSSGSLGGYAIFRQTPQMGSPSEGTVPLQTQFPSMITLPYDNTAGFVMGVALANLSTSSASVTATMWDANGNQLGTQTITIAGSGHTSFVLPTQLPVTAGQLGIVHFQSAAGGIAGLGLRFSPFGTFTSVPTF